ncbi:MAG: hypothetical protein M3329_04860 [Pseudomonadota bacterium]|nr:hypothetical protein [Pseudomonadota bacterium]
MSNTYDRRLRARIAQEAARILLDEGVTDHQLAKRKAADRLNAGDRSLPRNSEIERAVLDHRRLFFTEGYDHIVAALRQAAFDAMSMLSKFQPRLVGAVLDGTAGQHSEINLHLYADAVEEVIFLLMDIGVQYRSAERRLRYADDARYCPALRFETRGHEVGAVVLPIDALKQPPLSPVDGKPMRRANLKQVASLLEFKPGDEAWEPVGT